MQAGTSRRDDTGGFVWHWEKCIAHVGAGGIKAARVGGSGSMRAVSSAPLADATYP